VSDAQTINPENDLTHDPSSNIAFFTHDTGGKLKVLQEVLRDFLLEDFAELIARKQELLGSVGRAPLVIADAEACERMAELQKQIRACHKAAEAKRVDYKEPFLTGGRTVDAVAKREITDPLDRSSVEIGKRLTVWQRKVAEEERQRREAEARRQAEEAAAAEAEAQRLAAEAAEREADATTEEELEAAIAASEQAAGAGELADQARNDLVAATRHVEAKPAELSRVRTDLGAVASLRTFWDFDPATLDRSSLDWDMLAAHISTECIEKAIRSFIRAGGRECGPKLRIFENTASRVV
jgi:hypothetical protein